MESISLYRPGHKRVYYAGHIGPTLNQGESLLRSLITPRIWMMSNPMTPITSHSVSRLRKINKFRVPNQICVPNQISRIEEGIFRDLLPSQSLSRRRTRIENRFIPLQVNGVTISETADTIVSVPTVISPSIEVINPQTNLVTSILAVEAQLLRGAAIITSFLSYLYSAGARFNEGLNSSTIVGSRILW